jgi:hypothetical protein
MARPTRVRFEVRDGKKVRVAVKSGEKSSMADKYTPRLKSRYDETIAQGDDREVRLQERACSAAIEKITLNMGVGEATQDKKKVTRPPRKWS